MRGKAKVLRNEVEKSCVNVLLNASGLVSNSHRTDISTLLSFLHDNWWWLYSSSIFNKDLEKMDHTNRCSVLFNESTKWKKIFFFDAIGLFVHDCLFLVCSLVEHHASRPWGQVTVYIRHRLSGATPHVRVCVNISILILLNCSNLRWF